MKAIDEGMEELLELIKTNPDLISALVFNPLSIKRLLKTKAARRLVLGVDTQAFLSELAAPNDGNPIALCLERTAILCPGTRCPEGRGTRHPKPCGRHTKPLPECPEGRGTRHPEPLPRARAKR